MNEDLKINKNKKKILYLILSTRRNKDRQKNILDSWGHDQDVFFYSEYDDPPLKVIKVCEENNVVKKQIFIFDKIKKYFYDQYEWFFFGDDDTFVNTNLLLKKLDQYDKNHLHGVDMGGNWGDLTFPSGGAGFLINNQIIHNFFEPDVPNVPHSDVAIGFLMRHKNIKLMSAVGFCYSTPDHHKIKMDETCNYVTFHYIRDRQEMMDLYDICQKNLN
jgi:hypothetical protein